MKWNYIFVKVFYYDNLGVLGLNHSYDAELCGVMQMYIQLHWFYLYRLLKTKSTAQMNGKVVREPFPIYYKMKFIIFLVGKRKFSLAYQPDEERAWWRNYKGLIVKLLHRLKYQQES